MHTDTEGEGRGSNEFDIVCSLNPLKCPSQTPAIPWMSTYGVVAMSVVLVRTVPLHFGRRPRGPLVSAQTSEVHIQVGVVIRAVGGTSGAILRVDVTPSYVLFRPPPP